MGTSCQRPLYDGKLCGNIGTTNTLVRGSYINICDSCVTEIANKEEILNREVVGNKDRTYLLTKHKIYRVDYLLNSKTRSSVYIGVYDGEENPIKVVQEKLNKIFKREEILNISLMKHGDTGFTRMMVYI